MMVITRGEFDRIIIKRGLFAFLNGESCKLCDRYMVSLKDFKDTKFYRNLSILLLRDDDRQWLFVDQQVLSTPLTRLYVDGLPVFQKGGILFDSQIKEFEKKLLEYSA